MIDCRACGRSVSSYLMCDETDGEWCGDCFESATQCSATHGEGCATLALSLERAESSQPAAEDVRAENERLRAALARSKDPCMYCQLPAEEIARCHLGAPGCARLDDMVGCAEFGAMMENTALREILRRFIAAEDCDAIEAAKEAARAALGEAQRPHGADGNRGEENMSAITLGEKARDKITGYSGTATARVESIDRAPEIRIERLTGDGKHDAEWFAESRLDYMAAAAQ